MVTTAEQVAVELTADTAKLDRKVKQSAQQFGGEMDKIEKAAQEAEQAIQTLAASQERYSTRTSRLKVLLDAGRISQRQFNAEMIKAKGIADQAATAYRNAAASANAGALSTRQLAQQSRLLGFQISDIGQGLAVGTSPFIILAQQGGQLAMALEGSRGALGRVAGFLTTGWGAAVLAATTILGGLIFANRETEESVDDLVESLKKQAAESDRASEAQEIFADTLEGVRQALIENQEALDNLAEADRSAAQAALENAEAQRVKAIEIRKASLAALQDQRDLLRFQVERATGPSQSSEIAALGLGRRQAAVDRAEARVAEAEAALATAESQKVQAQSFVDVERAARTAQDRINERYDDQIEKAREAAVASGKVGEALEREVEGINAVRRVELERQREADRASRRSTRRRSSTRRSPEQIAADRAERERVREVNRREAFERALEQAQQGELDARQKLITNAEELDEIELDAIELSRRRYNDQLDAQVSAERLTQEEAEQLRAINEARAELRAELVRRTAAERQFRIDEENRRRALEFNADIGSAEAELLQGQQDLADTQAERRRIERRLIELQYAEEKARNDYLIGYYARLQIQEGVTESELAEAEAAAGIAQLRNGTLEQRQANATTASDRGTASPFEAFLDTLPDTAGEVNEALESIAAGGLRSLVDGLTDAIVNFRSLGDVARTVVAGITAELVRLALQQVILKVVGQTAGNAAVASAGAQAAATGAAWAPAAALASLATLGANAGPAAIALASTTALAGALAASSSVAGLRDGGEVIGPGGPRDDKVLRRLSRKEFVINAESSRKIGLANLNFMNRTGQIPGFEDGGAVIGGIRAANRPATRSSGGGMAMLDEASIGKLASVVARAAEAMPPVQLYPTLDPGKAFEAGLNSPGGQRAFFDFLNQNSARFQQAANP